MKFMKTVRLLRFLPGLAALVAGMALCGALPRGQMAAHGDVPGA
jgi:hypothetical protein